MKRNLKLLSVILLIALSSCQEDNIYQENKPNSLKVKEITFSNAKENKFLDNTLSKVFEGIKSHKSANKSTTPVEDNDFTIDQSSNVKVMSEGTSTTYTMLIRRAIESPEYFENLVVKITNDSQPKAYIFKYIPSEESHYIYIHNEYSFKGNFEVHEILYNSSVFQPLVDVSGCGQIALCDYGGITHNAGENCTEVYYVIGDCEVPTDGGASIPPYTAPIGSPAGGSAALQGNVLKMNTFLNNLSFAKKDLFATFPQGAQDAIFYYFVANNFANGSTGKVSTFLQSIISNNLASYFTSDISATSINPNLENSTNSIINHLIQNNFSSQSTTFVNQMISASIANGSTFTFDGSLNATNAMSFNHVSDSQTYLNNFHDSSGNEESLDDTGIQTKTSRFKFDIGSFTYLNMQVKQKLKTSSQQYSIESINSSISGNTFAIEFTQNHDDDLTIVGNVATITLTGTIAVDLFVEGLGSVFGDDITIVCSFNATTGHLISGHIYGLD